MWTISEQNKSEGSWSLSGTCASPPCSLGQTTVSLGPSLRLSSCLWEQWPNENQFRYLWLSFLAAEFRHLLLWRVSDLLLKLRVTGGKGTPTCTDQPFTGAKGIGWYYIWQHLQMNPRVGSEKDAIVVLVYSWAEWTQKQCSTPDFELPSGQSLNNIAIIWTSVCDAACLPGPLAYIRVLLCATFQVQCVTSTTSFPFQEVLSKWGNWGAEFLVWDYRIS